MKKALLLAILLMPAALAAQSPPYMIDAIRTAFAFETITVAAVSIGFTAATINPTVAGRPASQTRAELAVFNCELGTLRYRLDGTDPTASVGNLLNIGDTISVYGYNNIKNFRMIRVTGTSASCSAHYFRFSSNAN